MMNYKDWISNYFYVVCISIFYSLVQVPFASNIYGLIVPNFGVGFAIGKSTLDYPHTESTR